MASIINASSSGSGGIVQTADASGVLQLQSNGVTALSTSGANVTIAGTLTAAAQSIAKASLPTGSVLQVVNATRAGNSVTTTSASDVSWGATASITPTSSSSKIYIIASGAWFLQSGNATEWAIAIQRNGVTIPTGGNDGLTCVYGAGLLAAPYVITILDSPATTSSTTYLVVAHNINSGTSGLTNGVRATQLNQITLMEIAA